MDSRQILIDNPKDDFIIKPMDSITINTNEFVYIFPLNESGTKKLLWSFDEFDGYKWCECVEQMTFHPTTIQPIKIWHNGNNAQYLRLIKHLNKTDTIKYVSIMCEDYEKPEDFEPLNYPDF